MTTPEYYVPSTFLPNTRFIWVLGYSNTVLYVCTNRFSICNSSNSTLYFSLVFCITLHFTSSSFPSQIIKDLLQQTSNNFDESLLFHFENSREAALHNAIVLEYYNFNINDAINQTLRTLPISKSFCKITLIGVYSTKYLGKEQLSPSTRFWMILGYKIFCFIRKEATTNQQRQIMMH